MKHGQTLPLDRCPHCNVAKPNLVAITNAESENDRGENLREWRTYKCRTCGGVVMAVAPLFRALGPQDIKHIWPKPQSVHETVPERARTFLEQAIASIHAPAGAVMLTASSVDAMFKEKGLKQGNLYKRIDAAAQQHLITAEMALWAHEVRLDANDQRHADEDEDAVMPNEADASKAIEFVTALAQFLFVLPARVAQGRGHQ
ncbi:DUF4145 domain-containing protein [Pseudomonas viridiflava]|uniref:DUF4145 domain-containing protein n=1 Tax=Pseudomonas viridiflava TaxID=33069 RepID=UPI000F03EDE1|nr:DUF4145 domain-containing protein [Pseudomonas viridiflava]MEE4102978.1 DUF4145 domain-containing protein [Pseudomonas viridiflava]